MQAFIMFMKKIIVQVGVDGGFHDGHDQDHSPDRG
jgi:hypothetical protein